MHDQTLIKTSWFVVISPRQYGWFPKEKTIHELDMSVACTIQNPIKTRWLDHNNLPHSNLCESKSMIIDWNIQSTTYDIRSDWQGPTTFYHCPVLIITSWITQSFPNDVRSDGEGVTSVSPLLGAYFSSKKKIHVINYLPIQFAVNHKPF